MKARLATTTLAASLVFTGLSALDAGAATVQSYNYTTSGSIDNQAGVGPIAFTGVNFSGSGGSPAFTTPGTFSLGQFDAASTLPSTATLTYNNTPFTINMNVSTGNGSNMYYTYQINGNLNGSITGSGLSTMVATIASITGVPEYANGVWTTPPFSASEIQINAPQGINAPVSSTHSDGLTSLYAQVNPLLLNPVPAPEPASIAVFGAGLIVWGLRRRMTRSKRLAID